MKSQNTLLILFSLLFFPYVLFAYNIRQISSKDGLVNSAVLTLQQAQNGELFIGTCDGVNIFNGKNIKSINASADKDNNLLGNLITKIIETEPNIFWIQSNFGLDRYDRINNTIKHFKEFNDNNSLTKDNHNNLFVFNSDNTFHIYNE
ncbi:MAG: hybrid sensor histidine kinase/response regulator, partial [Bacteroidales bacterium]|nr:hybrid sensor histidine kinase/response regulator [Bacteroidales bacterium]